MLQALKLILVWRMIYFKFVVLKSTYNGWKMCVKSLYNVMTPSNLPAIGSDCKNCNAC